MNFELKRKLCILSIICCSSFSPVFAENQYLPEVLEGFVQEYKMSDLSPSYISDVEKLLNNQINSDKFELAEKTADYFVDISKKYYGRRSEKTASAYLTRAMLYKNYLIPDKAFKDLNKAKKILKKSEDENMKMELNSSYANLYREIGQYYDAIKMVEEMPQENIHSETKYRKIAGLYAKALENDKAKEYLSKAVKTYESDPNINKYDLISTYSDLADLSNPDEALKYIEEIEKIAASMPESEKPAKIFAKMKKLQYNVHRLNKGSAYKKQLDELNAMIGPNPSPNNDIAMAWLYIAYYEQNNPAMIEKYRKILSKYYSEFDWSVIPSNSLILMRKYNDEINANFNNLAVAQSKLEKAFELITPVKKHVPLMYANTLMKGVQVSMAKGDIPQAEKYLQEAQKVLNSLSEEPKSQMASLYGLYADFYNAQDDKEQTIEYLNKSLDKFNEIKASSYSDIFNIYRRKANLYLEMGDKQAAIENMEKSIQTVKEAYGTNHVKVYDTMFNAYKFYENFDKTKAEATFNEVINGLDSGKVVGVFPELFYSAYIKKADNSTKEENYKEAAKYGEKALKYALRPEYKQKSYEILLESYCRIPGKGKLAAKYKILSGM